MHFLKATLAAPGRSSSAVGSKSRPQAAVKDIDMLKNTKGEQQKHKRVINKQSEIHKRPVISLKSTTSKLSSTIKPQTEIHQRTEIHQETEIGQTEIHLQTEIHQ
jgi:hypothetical protein